MTKNMKTFYNKAKLAVLQYRITTLSKQTGITQKELHRQLMQKMEFTY